MPSPICRANGQSLTDGYDTNPGATVTVSLISNSGVNSWYVQCFGTDNQQSMEDINANISYLTHDGINQTAYVPMPATARGCALVFKSVVNNGIDSNGVIQPSYTTTFGLFAVGGVGQRLIASGQTIEGNATYGWIEDLNKLLSLDVPRNPAFGSSNITVDGYLNCQTFTSTDYTTNFITYTNGLAFSSNLINTAINTYYIDSGSIRDGAIAIGPNTTVTGDGSFHIYMPAPTAGRLIMIIDMTAHGVIVYPYASEQINYGSSHVLSGYSGGSQNVENVFISDGTDWFIAQSRVM